MSRKKEGIPEIKARLYQLGPLLPGSISKQWNVCGTPGCKCKDKKEPQRHGPYFQLSYSLGGKSSSVFIKPDDVVEVRRRIKRYREFKELCAALVVANVEDYRQKKINGR